MKATRPKTKKKTRRNWGPYTSNVRVLVIITVSVHLILIAFAIRRCSPIIKRCGLLVTQVIFVNCYRDEVHRLKVLSFGLGLTTVLYVLNICLEEALLVESIRSKDQQEPLKELRAVLLAAPAALLLGVGRIFNSCLNLSLRFGVDLFQMALQASFFDLQGLLLFLHLFQVAFVLGCRFLRLLIFILELRAKIDRVDPMTFNARANS